MNSWLYCFLFLIVGLFSSGAQKLGVSSNGRFLVTEDGSPFFWLADTAWELFHRCDRAEVDLYLQTRADQGFTVIQAVVLAELEGLTTPNPYGDLPLHNADPTQPNEAYFRHVDYVINKAKELGLYIALLPTWGDKVNTKSWGAGPEIFFPENAYSYGKWIGNRYKDADNIVWILGGDRNPRAGSQDVNIWKQMAEGIVSGAGGYEATLMSFHPQPNNPGGSSTWFHNEAWLDFNMHQTGHCANKDTYKNIANDYNLTPIKPVVDGEPLYEDHPNCFNAKELGHSIPEDIRRIMYWNVFAGAFGQTYGCHDVWQMYMPGREGVNQPLRPWTQALYLPLARQVKHLKNLMLSRPFLNRIPDQSLINTTQEDDQNYISATRSSDGSYALIYFPSGGSANLNLEAISSTQLKVWWFDPRTGHSVPGKEILKSDRVPVTAPTQGMGHDWVLVLDAPDANFGIPGKPLVD